MRIILAHEAFRFQSVKLQLDISIYRVIESSFKSRQLYFLNDDLEKTGVSNSVAIGVNRGVPVSSVTPRSVSRQYRACSFLVVAQRSLERLAQFRLPWDHVRGMAT